jgi:hypothetical protein
MDESWVECGMAKGAGHEVDAQLTAFRRVAFPKNILAPVDGSALLPFLIN